MPGTAPALCLRQPASAIDPGTLNEAAVILPGLAHWPAPLQRPDQVVVHLLGIPLVLQKALGRKDAGVARFEEFVSEQQVTLNAAQLAALEALLKDERALSPRPGPQMKCAFHADIGVQWVRDGMSAYAIFCFTCGETIGTAGIGSFDIKRVGAFAARLFPSHDSFRKFAAK